MPEVTSPRAWPRHLRTLRICMSGARYWWRTHGLDWNDFLSNGIEADTLAATDDYFALRVAELARTEHGQR